ncbi:MAG: TonB-dependent receptor [Saprospiraceae bacterium]|nr:TonB-dependent receptor [Saprospiraceae bacterium]
MYRFMLLACLWLSLGSAYGFPKPFYRLLGNVVDAESNPMPFAVVVLFSMKDSAMVKTEVCDESGHFVFEIEPNVQQAYYLNVSMVFYESYFSSPIELNAEQSQINLGTIKLKSSSNNLNEITIHGKKPFIERKSDRFVLNVESSILANGSSAFEMLEKAPGITINYLDAIVMKGKTGVVILIDGKQSPLAGTDLANYLKALPSNSLDRIEIISNPSAKYEAAGNAGIIDIRLKKDQRFGTNGSVSANYGQGIYPKAGIGLNLNHRTKYFNLFGSSNYSFRKGLNKLLLYREFFENGKSTGAYDQQNYLVFPFHYNTIRLGTDYYFPNGKTILGVVASGSINRFKPHGENNSNVENALHEKVSSFETSNRSSDLWPNYAFNFNAKHSFDSLGTELTLDIDYARFWNETEQNFLTKYYDLKKEPIKQDYYLYGDLNGILEIRSLKIDFNKSIFKHWKMEAGIKSSIVDADNDLAFYDKSNLLPVYDSTKSNHFLYQENINAAYLNYHYEKTKLSVQAGLRVEQTIAIGKQIVNENSFDREYTNLFPSFFVNYAVKPTYDMGFNISRRLDRPHYQQLNPFKFFLDPSTYKEGNPFLNPQYSWVLEWNHSILKNYNISVSYTNTKDNITEVIGPVEGQDRITVQTNENLLKFENISISGSTNINILKNWSSMINVSSWLGKYRGNFANTSLQDGNIVLNLSSNNSIKFEKDWSGEFSLSYQTPEVYGFMKLETMWGINLGIQKQFLNKKASIKLSATDLFWTNLPKANIQYRDYFERFVVKRETRVVSCSFNYRFGNTKIAGSRKRVSGAEDEKKRASSGQG